MTLPPIPPIFEALDDTHDVSGFTCGKESLDRYVREQITQDRRRLLACPFIMRLPASPVVIGYYTLCSSSVVRTDLPPSIYKRLGRYDSVPATLIGRLAIARHVQGQHYGAALMINAFERCVSSAPTIATALVLVEALDDAAASFYLKMGFTPFDNDPHRLFVMMAPLIKRFQRGPGVG